MTGVPIVGLPGVEVKVREGARVIVNFARGEPDAPRATLFDPTSLAELKVTADAKVTLDAPAVYIGKSAGRGIMRVGDFFTFTVATSAAGPFTGVAQAASGSNEAFA